MFSSIFGKEKKEITLEMRSRYGFACGIAGIVLNLILCAAKFFAGALSGSIAIQADAFNNLSDAGSSIVTLLGFKLAGQKADYEHPFGHGRYEYISGLIVSMAILLMGLELFNSSLGKVISPAEMDDSFVAIIILAASILVKLFMAWYNSKIGKMIESSAMSATAQDSLSDCISTSAVLLGTLIFKFFDLNIDGYIGLLVALFIMYSGFNALKETISPLLGQPPKPEYVKEVENIVMSGEYSLGIHDFIYHDYGPGRVMISLHVEVPANGDLLTMHDSIDNLERVLREKLNCEAVIHMDPIVVDDGKTSEMRTKVAEIVRTLDSRLSIHDFRMVEGPSHINLIFDVIAPYDVKKSDELIKKEIGEVIRQLGNDYYAVVTVDKSYVV